MKLLIEVLYTFSTSTLYRAIHSGVINISIEKGLKFRGKRKGKKRKIVEVTFQE